MSTEYTATFRDVGAVEKYEHLTYAPGSYAARVHARQRDFLRGLIQQHFPARRPVQHDFACGTGRAIRALDGLVRDAHGYDTSPAMLAKAAEVGGRAHWHQVAADGPVPTPAPVAGPAVVTMFRLMLNVGDDVRHRALSFAAKILTNPAAGLLIVENHGNARSVRHLGARRRAGHRWFAELSHRHMTDLMRRHGFRIIGQHGSTMLSRGWYDRPGIRTAAPALDAVTRRVPGAGGFAVNVLYVAQRLPAPR
jgi:SAM-dependent methyltransferase